MKVILFGASGMVGQGVLRECLLDPEVESVLSIGRASLGKSDAKLIEIIRSDVADLADFEDQLTDYDACFYCLGVSSFGMSEEAYRKVSYDLTLRVAERLLKLNRSMTFTFVTGTGADSTGKGRVMWARVKGAAENALLQLPFKAAYMFRPGVIQPLHGIKSKTKLYQSMYVILNPLFALAKKLFPNHITTTENVGRAMLQVAKQGGDPIFLENRDINRLAVRG